MGQLIGTNALSTRKGLSRTILGLIILRFNWKCLIVVLYIQKLTSQRHFFSCTIDLPFKKLGLNYEIIGVMEAVIFLETISMHHDIRCAGQTIVLRSMKVHLSGLIKKLGCLSI